MAWFKAFHLIFMVTWFAGLFYLPRLFVYHAMSEDDISHQRFLVMERKLFIIMTMGAVLTLVFGTALLMSVPYLAGGIPLWLKIKLVLLAMLAVYHWHCTVIMRAFRERKNKYSHVFFRWYNEAPAILLIAIVLLAVFRPS